MAIVNSLAIGKSRKSAGNLTYKTVRGRTIASQRITENKSNTIAQGVQRNRFAMASQAISMCQLYVNYAYEKSKYGSARNEFMKTNPGFNLGGVVPEIKGGDLTIAYGFLSSIQKTASEPRIIDYVSKGSLAAIVSGTSKNVPSFKFDGHTFENINAWDSLDGDGMIVTFPNPVKLSDVQIAVIGFGARSVETAIGTIDIAGSFTLDGNSGLKGAAATSRAFLSDDGQFVKSIHFEISLGGTDDGFGCAVAIPIVGGKTVTTTAVWLGTADAG